MECWKNGQKYTIPDPTPEEVAAIEKESTKAAAIERTRPLSESEVSRMLITAQINTLTVDDSTALRMKSFYPTWEDCVKLGTVEHDKPGFKFSYGDKLFSCINANPTFQQNWVPGIDTASLYTEINETHDGALEDPIPYSGNMILENGKYYIQDYEIYQCIRDTGIAVYQPLSALVGLYVEVA